MAQTCVKPTAPGAQLLADPKQLPKASDPPWPIAPGPWRFLTIVRHPKESFWSIVNYFGFWFFAQAKLKHLNEMHQRVSSQPHTATARDVYALAEGLDKVMQPTNGLRQLSVVFGGAPLVPLDYSQLQPDDPALLPSWSSSPKTASPPSVETIANRAHERFAQDFVVGLFEDMDEFLAMLALELGWPTDALCLPFAHTRRKDQIVDQRNPQTKLNSSAARAVLEQRRRGEARRGEHYRSMYGPGSEVDRALSQALFIELAVHDRAVQVHEAQVAKHSSRVHEIKALLGSAPFQQGCSDKRRRAASKRSHLNETDVDHLPKRKKTMLLERSLKKNDVDFSNEETVLDRELARTCAHFDVLGKVVRDGSRR